VTSLWVSTTRRLTTVTTASRESRYHHHHSQNNTFSATAFRRRLSQIWSGFWFFGFCNNNFSTEQGLQPWIQHPQPGGPVAGRVGRVAQLYPQATGSLFIALYNLQDCDAVIPTHLYTWRIRIPVALSRYKYWLFGDWTLSLSSGKKAHLVGPNWNI
jgi:hypothetical protein